MINTSLLRWLLVVLVSLYYMLIGGMGVVDVYFATNPFKSFNQ